MKSFQQKVAAITGAGSGIGRALALALAREGCHLALADVDAGGLQETAASARQSGVTVSAACVDVADRAAVFAWADAVMSEHGRVNLLFNNAGVAHAGTVAQTPIEDYEWIVNINFWGVVYGTKAFLPHLKASGEGHVVNISSIFGVLSQPGMSAYNATKFAVRGMTESLRQELDLEDGGVSASCVHPGGIRTAIAQRARVSGTVLGLADGADGRASMQQVFAEKLLRTSPDRAAQVILDGVRRNRRRILIGSDAWMLDGMQRLLPAGYQRLITGSLRWVR